MIAEQKLKVPHRSAKLSTCRRKKSKISNGKAQWVYTATEATERNNNNNNNNNHDNVYSAVIMT